MGELLPGSASDRISFRIKACHAHTVLTIPLMFGNWECHHKELVGREKWSHGRSRKSLLALLLPRPAARPISASLSIPAAPGSEHRSCHQARSVQNKLPTLLFKYPPLITRWHLQSLLCACQGPAVPPFWLLSPDPQRGDPKQRTAKARLVCCCTLNSFNKRFLKCPWFGPYFPELLNATTSYLLKSEQLFPALCHISINNHTFPVCLSSFHHLLLFLSTAEPAAEAAVPLFHKQKPPQQAQKCHMESKPTQPSPSGSIGLRTNQLWTLFGFSIRWSPGANQHALYNAQGKQTFL